MSEFKFRALTPTEADWQNLEPACYTSPLLDSGIPSCVWHRIAIDADIPEGSKLEASFYTSESDDEDGQKGTPITFQEGGDILLNIPPGRYIKLNIISYSSNQGSPVLKLVKIYYLGDAEKFLSITEAQWKIAYVSLYTSPLLDSGIPGCVWHRIAIDADIPEGSKMEASFCTSESDDEDGQGDKSLIFQKGRDALLDVPPGRYIKLKIISRPSCQGSPILKLAKIYYPRTSYLRYLPAAYQNDSASSAFLERFLSIFETELLGSEETIDRLPSFFDPNATPQEYISWLANWLSLDLYEIVEEKNREFILKAMEFYRKKGTLIGLSELITFLVGKNCQIKEYTNNIFRSYGMEHFLLESSSGQDCATILQYHHVSLTVDSRNKDLLGRMGTFEDEVHYTFDGRSLSDLTEMYELPRSSPWVVGVFIPLKSDESLEIDPEKIDGLYKIIKSFLPVFVDILIILYTQDAEEYPLSSIQDSFSDSIIAGSKKELVPKPAGEYRDKSNWKWLWSYKSIVEGITNHVGFRTFNDHIVLDGEAWDISFDI